ncbi:hypothetical protein RsTz2092_07690 [Deferribacterales bacterium RsTz2092]
MKLLLSTTNGETRGYTGGLINFEAIFNNIKLDYAGGELTIAKY